MRPRVAVRVNPDFQVKGSGMRMGGGPQQFGIDAEQVPAVPRRPRRRGCGFPRVPCVRRIPEPQRRDPRARRSARPSISILALAEKAPAPVRYVNLGGGFGIPYFDKDQPLDLAAIGANLADLVDGSDRAEPARAPRS